MTIRGDITWPEWIVDTLRPLCFLSVLDERIGLLPIYEKNN